jgi:hypothetical protein
MKKIFIMLSLASIILTLTTCKKDEEVVKFISPNKLSVEINGKIENDFFIGSIRKASISKLYDTIPFPRIYSCHKEKISFALDFQRKLDVDFYEGFQISGFYPFINSKQKYNTSKGPLPLVTPKSVCDYDSAFYTGHNITWDGDYFAVNYKADEKGINDLTITSYDTLSGKMTGEFNLTFDKVYRNIREKYYESLPQKLEYRNGKFTVFFKPIK